MVKFEQILQASVIWKQCAQLPTGLSRGKTTVINGNVYYGGGVSDFEKDEYIVYCYDPSQDKWTALPPLPVRWFGLGQVNGKLVAVGGERRNKKSNNIYTYDEQSRKWKQTIPPMPTVGRYSSAILSLQSALLMAGGDASTVPETLNIIFIKHLDAVNIFKVDTSQWYTTNPLPVACQDISLVAVGNICYALGGYGGSYFNQALYASVDDLLGNAVPANQTTHNGSSDTQSAWKKLPNTPTYRPAAAVLAGTLFAIGGKETSKGGADKKEVYMYSPSTNSWIYISDLPAPQSVTTVAVLSSTEILVIGGRDDRNNVNTVYKGTLQLV
jgi:N-acetylneuraminic acid mutarotase